MIDFQLYSSQDGSGTMDFDEFCEMMMTSHAQLIESLWENTK